MNLEKIRNFLKVDNNSKLLIVFIVFGITGSLTLYISDILFIYFDISKNEFGYFFIFIRILIIFPIYQLLLIIIGTLFGEFKYFWQFEKKFLRKIGINLK